MGCQCLWPNLAWSSQKCSDLLQKIVDLNRKSEPELVNQSAQVSKQTLSTNLDSTEGAKAAIAQFFKDDPELSLEKNWKRNKKWKVDNRIYRSFTSKSGREIVVVFDLADNAVNEKNQSPVRASELASTAVKKLPPHRFLFAFDRVGMSADPDGFISIVIITRKLFEKEEWVPDHMESRDRNILDPILKHLGIEERMSNEFQMMSPMPEAELKARLIELGLDYSSDLQSVVDEMGAM